VAAKTESQLLATQMVETAPSPNIGALSIRADKPLKTDLAAIDQDRRPVEKPGARIPSDPNAGLDGTFNHAPVQFCSAKADSHPNRKDRIDRADRVAEADSTKVIAIGVRDIDTQAIEQFHSIGHQSFAAALINCRAQRVNDQTICTFLPERDARG
jgi:hypothetical protein